MSWAGLWVRCARRLSARWSAGTVEPLPRLRADGETNVPGLLVAGDLAGAASLRAALDSGADAAAHVAADPALRSVPAPDDTLDLAVVGGGAAGFAAALVAHHEGLSCEIVEAHEPFLATAGQPPMPPQPGRSGPTDAPEPPAGSEEPLLADLRAQAESAGLAPRIAQVERVERADGLLRVVLEGGAALTARRVIVATGRTGCPRRLDVPGERLAHVFHRLHDPAGLVGRQVVIVGGGQCSAGAAVALAESGAEVTLLYRGAVLTRPRLRTLSRLSELLAGAPTEPFRRGQPRSAVPRRTPGPGTVTLRLMTRLLEIRPGEAVLGPADGPPEVVRADAVLVLVGSDPARAFLERSGVAMRG